MNTVPRFKGQCKATLHLLRNSFCLAVIPRIKGGGTIEPITNYITRGWGTLEPITKYISKLPYNTETGVKLIKYHLNG